ncbi:hypothetical protein [Frankia sp. KB5]|uniref:hypothetical protein n=1 Tax=Frankia sp. KB5 TaxID=683318 RepID=UPI000A11EBC8|nr:hypothetical protein [Frankia sp. KB5]ORT49023.1 hypothetical protein KBI5_14860 [Frankia sp. KB5]
MLRAVSIVLAVALVAAIAAIAGLVAGILHAADGDSLPAAARAGGRAALAVLGVLAALAGAVLAAVSGL